MGYNKSRKKLKKYLECDDFSKLQSYLSKHKNIDINELKFEDGNTLLHMACFRGLDHIVWYLIKQGGDPLSTNDRLETPLHIACHFSLKESHYAFYDLVQPLSDKAPRSMSCADNNGVTPRDLIKQIRRRLTQKGATLKEESSSGDEQSDKDDWQEKLSKETQDEYAQNWGNYETDFTDTRGHNQAETESFDSWTERMQKEMSHKRQKQYESKHYTRKKQKTAQEQEEESERQTEFQRKLEREHEEYIKKSAKLRESKIVERKKQYELKCEKILQNNDDSTSDELGYGDIPWPTPSNWNKEAESMKEFLLCDMNKEDETRLKKYLKEQQVRWHPDRFKQKTGSRLKLWETDRIMNRVKLISQILNKLVADYR